MTNCDRKPERAIFAGHQRTGTGLARSSAAHDSTERNGTIQSWSISRRGVQTNAGSDEDRERERRVRKDSSATMLHSMSLLMLVRVFGAKDQFHELRDEYGILESDATTRLRMSREPSFGYSLTETTCQAKPERRSDCLSCTGLLCLAVREHLVRKS